MNFAINIRHNNIEKLKTSLLYLFPNNIKDINFTINNLRYYNKIVINENKIYPCISYFDDNIIDDDIFLYDIKLLQKSDEINSIVIKNNSNNNYWLIIKMFRENNFIMRFRSYYKNIDKTYIMFLMINDYVYLICEKEYNIFFNSYKTINSDTYIRYFKLKQLL